MLWDVMVAVMPVTVLACFAANVLLTWLKKPHQGISQHGLLISSRYAPTASARNLSGGRYDTGR
jgi:hypothetical protein